MMMAESTRMYPDSLELLWENKAIYGGQNEAVQIPGSIKSVVCEIGDGGSPDTSHGFVELFRSDYDWFDGMYIHMVDRDVVSFYEFQLNIPVYPTAAAVPTYNSCKGFIKGTGPTLTGLRIYRVYAGKRIHDGLYPTLTSAN